MVNTVTVADYYYFHAHMKNETTLVDSELACKLHVLLRLHVKCIQAGITMLCERFQLHEGERINMTLSLTSNGVLLTGVCALDR